MSISTARPASGLPAPPDRPLSPRNERKAHSMGLTSATGLVIGSTVGTGVFTMPAVLAGAGTMSLIVLGVIAGRRAPPRCAVRPAHQASAE
jgi:APA family basic amino acid/polyamine antiporter